MRDDEVVALIAVLVISAVALTVYVGLIVLGVNMAKRKNRSPHWFWFAVHPVGLLITLIVMACLPPLQRCPNCQQCVSRARAPLRILRIRFRDSRILRASATSGVHAAPILVLSITKEVRQAFSACRTRKAPSDESYARGLTVTYAGLPRRLMSSSAGLFPPLSIAPLKSAAERIGCRFTS